MEFRTLSNKKSKSRYSDSMDRDWEDEVDTEPTLLHLNMDFFKVFECTKVSSVEFEFTKHNHKFCPYYHNWTDRKRLGVRYSRDLCEYAQRVAFFAYLGPIMSKSRKLPFCSQ
jgi:hypothetical protein